MPRAPRIAFVTIGQAPRVDLVPEILERIGAPVEAAEFGALDDLSLGEVAKLHPPPGVASLATRMRDGTEVVIGKPQVAERLQQLFERLDADARGFDAIALLCTGYFEHIGSKTLLVEAQRVVDATVDALSMNCGNLGVMLPLARQVGEFHVQASERRRVTATHFSPYTDAGPGGRLEAAAREVAGCDLVVMHCMGYSEAMRERVAAAIDPPVLLARRMVASALQQLT